MPYSQYSYSRVFKRALNILSVYGTVAMLLMSAYSSLEPLHLTLQASSVVGKASEQGGAMLG